MDESSRLKQFAWEQWEKQIFVVIFRPGIFGLDRYVVKRYIEQVLSISEHWKQLASFFPTISPLIRAYTLTSYEIEVMKKVLDYHLNNKLNLHLNQQSDQLIQYDELLDFISHAQELFVKHYNPYNNNNWINGKKSSIPLIPTVHSTYTLPSLTEPVPLPKTTPIKPSPIINAPDPISKISPTFQPKSAVSHPPGPSSMALSTAKIDGNGWAQINNVYLPFIIKNQQRFAPYEVLVSCKILEANELRSVLVRATTSDLTLINSMIQDCKINSKPISENTSLINIHHVLIGTKNLIYVKILPKDNPTSKINRQYKRVLALRGGSLYINTHLTPFVCTHNHTYVPLNDILIVYPNLQTELKSLAHAPRTNEFDYLQLVQMYYQEKELSLDTLLISTEDLDKKQIIPTKILSLIDYHTIEKVKLEQQIHLLKNNSSKNKRKNLESHENRPSEQRLKSTDHCFSSNSEHRGRTRWQ